MKKVIVIIAVLAAAAACGGGAGGSSSSGGTSQNAPTARGGADANQPSKSTGLPKPIWGKLGVSVSGADSNRVYAIIEAKDGGIFMSDDAGTSWKLVNEDRRIRQRAFYYSRIYADPQTKETFYVLNTSTYRSTDAGKTLRALSDPHGDNHDLWIAPNDPKRMINSNDGGANVTTNGGESWTAQTFPTAQMYNVFTTNHERTAALPDFLDSYNHRRRHSALGGLPPISRLSPS